MIRFSLLHPSRGRLRLAEAAIAEWTGKASGTHPIEYILSVDVDDGDLTGYRVLAARHGLRLTANANRSVVGAANCAAREATGDVLVVVSDDFGCPERWDAELAVVLGDRRDAGVFVHDGIEARIMTLPILGRALYEQLGYVYHPAYFSFFVDDDLTHTVRGLGKLIDARHLVFPHRHWSVGAAPFDATYARESSNRAWLRGWRTFEKRRLVDFGRGRLTARATARLLVIEGRFWTRLTGSRVKRAVQRTLSARR